MCGKGHILSVLNTLGSKKTKKLTTDTTEILDTELKAATLLLYCLLMVPLGGSILQKSNSAVLYCDLIMYGRQKLP